SYKIFLLSSLNNIDTHLLDFGKYSYDLKKFPLLDIGKEEYKKWLKETIEKGKYVINIFYFIETSEYYITSYFFDKKIFTSLYDKNSKQNFILENYQFPTIKFYTEEKLYSIFEPLSFDTYLPEKLASMSDFEMDINDNPILIIYKFK